MTPALNSLHDRPEEIHEKKKIHERISNADRNRRKQNIIPPGLLSQRHSADLFQPATQYTTRRTPKFLSRCGNGRTRGGSTLSTRHIAAMSHNTRSTTSSLSSLLSSIDKNISKTGQCVRSIHQRALVKLLLYCISENIKITV